MPPAPFSDPSPAKCGFLGYFLLCLLCAGGTSILTIVAWSDLGYGVICFKLSIENYHHRYLFFLVGVLLLLLLYVVDVFVPPQFPGQYFVLWDGDGFWGRTACGLVLFFWMVACCVLARDMPGIPVLVMGCLCPAFLAMFRYFARSGPLPLHALHIACRGHREMKGKLLTAIFKSDDDTATFYCCAAGAFLLTGWVDFTVWLLRAYALQDYAEDRIEKLGKFWTADDPYASGLELMLFIAPLIVAIQIFVLGLLALFRVSVQRQYVSTDRIRNRLMRDGIVADVDTTWEDWMIFQLPHHLAKWKLMLRKQDAAAIEQPTRYLRTCERRQRVHHLSMVLKVFGCAWIVLTGCLYAFLQLITPHNEAAMLILLSLITIFIGMVVFSIASLWRIAKAVSTELSETPIWNFVRSAAQSDAMKALLLCCFVVIVPVVLSVSVLNQATRRCRGLYKRMPEQSHDESMECLRCPLSCALGRRNVGSIIAASSLTSLTAEQQRQLCLTPRVNMLVTEMRSWNWHSILKGVYIACFFFMVFIIMFPILLNVLLAWMTVKLTVLSFWTIALVTIVLGVFVFLLPPVPGMTVYMFAGLVLSNPATCPYGFWGGTIINIVLCWFLKLFACAVQQKCIGELLGRSLLVRHTAGVHRFGIRCIEALMKKPGLSIGKVAVLCGGPDWPTSVLAGLLHLNLLQCELGTLPIVLFVAPCALSGSFYLKYSIEDSEFWHGAANLMILTSVAISMFLWAVAGWAMQKQVQEGSDELTRKLEKNVDLEWMDYRIEKIAEVCTIGWNEFPMTWRVLYVMGAMTQIMVCDAFKFLSSWLLNDFKVYDGIENMHWYNDGTNGGIFSFWALAALSIFVAGWFLPIPFLMWLRAKTAEPKAQILEQLAHSEEAWKADYIQKCRNWKPAAKVSEQVLNECASSMNSELIDFGASSSSLRALQSICGDEVGSSMVQQYSSMESKCLNSASFGEAASQIATVGVLQARKAPGIAEEPEEPSAGQPEPAPEPALDRSTPRDVQFRDVFIAATTDSLPPMEGSGTLAGLFLPASKDSLPDTRDAGSSGSIRRLPPSKEGPVGLPDGSGSGSGHLPGGSATLAATMSAGPGLGEADPQEPRSPQDISTSAPYDDELWDCENWSLPSEKDAPVLPPWPLEEAMPSQPPWEEEMSPPAPRGAGAAHAAIADPTRGAGADRASPTWGQDMGPPLPREPLGHSRRSSVDSTGEQVFYL